MVTLNPRRLVCLLSLFTVTVSASPLPGSDNEIQEKEQTCYKGVYMIIARGTTEAPGEGKLSQVANLIAQAIPDSGRVSIPYPATFVDPYYGNSKDTGVRMAIARVSDYQRRCLSGQGVKPRIVLLGYSQGGNVMSDLIQRGESPLDRGILATVTFGDPTHNAHDPWNAGSSSDNGIYYREGKDVIPTQYAEFLRAYCDFGDPVCDRGIHESVHGNTIPRHKQEAADFVVSRYKSYFGPDSLN